MAEADARKFGVGDKPMSRRLWVLKKYYKII
jgi:hypothetical protein